MSDRNVDRERFDCIVIGGGPAGLLAATYLGRFRRRVLVADARDGRALNIPLINNCPGFPDGISGRDLVSKVREQAELYGSRFIDRRIESIARIEDGFQVRCGTSAWRAPRVLLATGALDRVPDLPEIDRNLKRRALAFCPVCDGYEASGKMIGVIGSSQHAIREASFLKTFSPRVSILVDDPERVSDELRTEAKAVDIALIEAVATIVSGSDGYEVVLHDRSTIGFDVLYPALGCDVRSDLASDLDVSRDAEGHIRTDTHQQTTVAGLYAAGDVVHSLNQIAVAFGQAATAATAIHNSLRANERVAAE